MRAVLLCGLAASIIIVIEGIESQPSQATNILKNASLNHGRMNVSLDDNDDAKDISLEIDTDYNLFIEMGDTGIVPDPADVVLLRLKNISMRTSSNIKEILAIQQEEFRANTVYKSDWANAVQLFNDLNRAKIFNGTPEHSIVRKVPVEYHIALIAYCNDHVNNDRSRPYGSNEFGKATREIRTQTDIENYKWKSYFKLLQLAVETLGTGKTKWVDNKRFLYRGVCRKYVLKEGQLLAFQHFMLAFTKLGLAEDVTCAHATLFEYQGLYDGTAMGVWDHSKWRSLKRVLFSPLQVFQVESIHVGARYTRVVLVKHQKPQLQPAKSSSRGSENIGCVVVIHLSFAALCILPFLSVFV